MSDTNQPPSTEGQDGLNANNPSQADSRGTNGGQPAPASVRTNPRAFKSKTGATVKGGTGFSVAEANWNKMIPQPGHYDALIVRAWINPKSDITYLNIDYQIVDQAARPYTISEMKTLDAKPTNPRHSQSAQGKGRVKAIMEANGKPLSFESIQAVPFEMTGCRVRIAVGHKYVDGLPAPVVQGIVGPAAPDEEP
jgi:hypothetical protein